MIRRLFLTLAFLLALAPAFGQGVVTDAGKTGLPAVGATAGFSATASVTRPANTTTYAASDVVGGSPTAVITFAGIGNAGAAMLITGADLRIDITAIPTGMTSFRLHLYSVTPPSAYADNAAWDFGSGDRAAYLGYVDLGSPADLGSTLYVQNDQVNKQLQLASGSTTLYGYLVTNGAIVPAAVSEVYNITLRAVQL